MRHGGMALRHGAAGLCRELRKPTRQMSKRALNEYEGQPRRGRVVILCSDRAPRGLKPHPPTRPEEGDRYGCTFRMGPDYR